MMIEADGITHTHKRNWSTVLINYAQNNTKKKTDTSNKKNHFRKSALFLPHSGAAKERKRFLLSGVRIPNTKMDFVMCGQLVNHTQPFHCNASQINDRQSAWCSYLCLFNGQMYSRFCVQIRTRRSNFMQFTHQHGHLSLQLLCDWFIFAPMQKTFPWWKQLCKINEERQNEKNVTWMKWNEWNKRIFSRCRHLLG